MSLITNKILLLGLGNDVLTDDAIGLNVVRAAQARLAGHTAVDVQETTEMGLALLDYIEGYRALIIVDSIQTHRAQPGTIHQLDPAELKSLTGSTPHFLGVGETLTLGRQLGLIMPEWVTILAVEVQEPFLLGSEMTPALRQSLPAVVERALAMIKVMEERISEAVQEASLGGKREP